MNKLNFHTFHDRLTIKSQEKPQSKMMYLLTLSVITFSISVTIITFIYSDKAPEGYGYMWLLPFTYSFLFYITNIRFSLLKYLGILVLSLILFVRYLILPLISSLTGYYFHSSAPLTNSDANFYTVIMMTYEMICIFVSLHYFINRLNKQQMTRQHIKEPVVDSGFLIYLIVIIVGIISLLYIPQISARTNFLFIRDEFELLNLNAFNYALFIFAVNAFKVLFIIFLTIAYKKKIKGHNYSQLLILLFAILSFGFFWTTNRLTVLAQAIATIALLININLVNRKLVYIMVLMFVFSILSMSTYRWFGYGISSDKETISDLTSHLDKKILDYLLAYFAGPHLISLAVNLEYDPSFMVLIKTFVNEILSYIMFINQIVPLGSDSTTVIYNKLFGFYWEPNFILPTLGQSYMFFGGAFSPLLSLLFIFLIYKVEKALAMTNSLGEKYAYYILLCWLAFFPVHNINIASSYIFNIFLPLFLIAKANKNFSKFSKRILSRKTNYIG